MQAEVTEAFVRLLSAPEEEDVAAPSCSCESEKESVPGALVEIVSAGLPGYLHHFV